MRHTFTEAKSLMHPKQDKENNTQTHFNETTEDFCKKIFKNLNRTREK